MDRETLNAFAHLARTFARKEVRAMVGQETRDGDLSLLPALLEKAEKTGLMSSPHPGHPGHDYGVWGRACLTEGPTASIIILEEIARECAGVALCLHAAGLGALELDEPILKRPALAFFPRNLRFSWDYLEGRTEPSPGTFTALAPRDWDGLLALYPYSQEWHMQTMAREKVQAEPLEPRTGLVAAEILQVSLPDDPPGIKGGDPRGLLRRHLLGITAIALGNALGAIEAARDYAAQRHQGGARIIDHPAVKLLLGEAIARIEAVKGQLYWTAHEDKDTREALLRAMALALRGREETWKATSNALQVLGGYGYMEDYRLEKRLRDAMTLRTLPPSPRDLLLMLGEGEKGEEG